VYFHFSTIKPNIPATRQSRFDKYQPIGLSSPLKKHQKCENSEKTQSIGDEVDA